MKKKIAFILAFIICCSVFSSLFTSFAAYTPPEFNPKIDEDAAIYMVNLDTGDVIYEQNADKEMYPASLTKIMTTLLALENTDDLDAHTVTAMNSLFNEFAGINISTAGILGGETLTMRQLLYCMMLQSANEAANMVAYDLGDDSIPNFVNMMNERAKELGCQNTNFANPHGLHSPSHYTTAKDMFLITQEALKNPVFKEICGSSRYTIDGTNMRDTFTLVSTNYMMENGSKYYNPYVTGVKTGTTDEAGRCLISTANKDGYTYLTVVMGAPQTDENGNELADNLAFVYTNNLLDWAFDTFRVKTLVEAGEHIQELPLRLVWGQDYIPLATGESFSALIPADIDSTSVQIIPNDDLPDYVKAPITEGEKLGTATVVLSGESIGTIDLIAGESHEANMLLSILDTIGSIFQSFWFKFFFALVIILVIGYIVLMIIRNHNRKKYKAIKQRRKL